MFLAGVVHEQKLRVLLLFLLPVLLQGQFLLLLLFLDVTGEDESKAGEKILSSAVRSDAFIPSASLNRQL